MYFLYSLLVASGLVVSAPWLAWQALRHGKYRHKWQERLGRLPESLAATGSPTLWLHAVSVGEVLSAAPLVAALRRDHPEWRVVVSTTTRTGRATAEARLSGVAGVFYFPLDFAWVVRRVLRHLRPDLLVIVETEIWPNLARLSRASGIGVLLVNARISDRSYPRYRLVRGLLGRVLAQFDRLCAQSEDTAARLRALGAPADRLVVTGSLKFDVPADAPAGVAAVAGRLEGRPVLLAASTLKGEDEVLLETFACLREGTPGALLVLAPRHPERFEAVATLAARTGLRVARRTALATDPDAPFDVLVLDTIGELAALCAQATVVFVGGSLVPAGGHNILEPARYARPIVVGPSMSNFAEIARVFLEAGALVQVPDAATAQRELLALFADPTRRQALGAAAQGVLDRHRGAVGRTMREISAVMATRAVAAGAMAGVGR
ncbi:3-deoxy-D-manno-octulosonic acid transferase [Luteitalea sp. TBR-22]|uniref:3-deoxy-D-manno-octulosonic acid transferase n=1 Tax=Luteitalea sp. TBR-22 TaxID=2802971 RepID=UPI001AF8A79D|nr:3-deoxy-D-manno-octulosonic acid transferase [Luteitalea sp. TBR-22]BCS34766.1 3-deoxy-D-manno-octulosonic acid transferase [Luteitalea sp. TBR-22]